MSPREASEACRSHLQRPRGGHEFGMPADTRRATGPHQRALEEEVRIFGSLSVPLGF